MKSTIFQHHPAPVLGLRTASYCTENEGTPLQAYDRFPKSMDPTTDLFLQHFNGYGGPFLAGDHSDINLSWTGRIRQ